VPVSDMREIRNIVERFAVPGRCVSAAPFGEGLINASWLVSCEEASGTVRFLLQRINVKVFLHPERVMANIAAVTAHLAQADPGRPVLTFVPAVGARPGEPLLHRAPDESCWRLSRFIENTRSGGRVSGPGEAATAGRAFGRFQRKLAGFPAEQLSEVIPGFHDTPGRCQDLERGIGADSLGRAAGAAEAIAVLRKHRPLADSLADLHESGALPLRVVHNDAKLDNVLLDEETGAAVCVVDLDTVMPGLSAWDFGELARTMACTSGEEATDLGRVAIDPALFAALSAGYLEEAGSVLTEAERRCLVTGGGVIIYEQAVRFLTDYLAGDTYYRTTRPNHNLDRCRNQIRLLESLLAARVELESCFDR